LREDQERLFVGGVAIRWTPSWLVA